MLVQKCPESLKVFLRVLPFLLGNPLSEEAAGQRIALVVEEGMLGLAIGAKGYGIDASVLGCAVFQNLSAAIPGVLFHQSRIALASGDDLVGQTLIGNLRVQQERATERQ